MGQRGSIEEVQSQGPSNLVPAFAPPWSILFSDTVEAWGKCAGGFGFANVPHGCVDRQCDRDSICLKKARAVLRKNNHSIEIQRYKQASAFVSYASQQELRQKLTQGFHLSEVVAAVRDDLALLILYRWEKLQYDAIFITADLPTGKILGTFESPTINMSIMECKISPDGSKLAILFYFRPDNDSPFEYDLYVFSVKTCRVLDIISCNTEVRPYVNFDPRFRSSRIAIVNYNTPNDGKNEFVLYCLERKAVIAKSHLMLSFNYGGGYFCTNYSRDGRFLILQKISDNMNGVHCYSDCYIFDANTFKLLKHYYANLQPFSTLCDSNYAPQFSLCSSRMSALSEETLEDGRKLHIVVYQLPWPLSLQEQCRIRILQSMRSSAAVQALPLPRTLKKYLQFAPEL